VQLIDEKNYLALCIFDFLQYCFETIFEFAAILCARQHRSEIETDQALVAESLWNVTRHDALRETFNDCGLADAGLAD
jgi:hypothetical protein